MIKIVKDICNPRIIIYVNTFVVVLVSFLFLTVIIHNGYGFLSFMFLGILVIFSVIDIVFIVWVLNKSINKK